MFFSKIIKLLKLKTQLIISNKPILTLNPSNNKLKFQKNKIKMIKLLKLLIVNNINKLKL